MNAFHRFRASGYVWLIVAMLAVTAIYWPGLSGGWLFDDYPNIVDNKGVQPSDISLPSLMATALSSPSSEFKRPLSSLSFGLNYLATGLDPYWMKLTNLVIHLLNGWLVFLLARALLAQAQTLVPENSRRTGVTVALITAGWMLLPINLTSVLYVVQRMESLANFFVLLGLIGYVAGRRLMLQTAHTSSPKRSGLLLCFASIIVPTTIGMLAKETAVMLPLYALLVEWALFRFDNAAGARDWRMTMLFVVVLALPIIIGLAWLLPGVLNPNAWNTRDFTPGTRLLSEARIVVGYIGWTLLPQPHALSFYHDDVIVSTSLLRPWTTLTSLLTLAGLIVLTLSLRNRWPLVSLGFALFLGCQLLTATILPLELVYEHRNYFASFGLLLAAVPLLSIPRLKRAEDQGAGPTYLWAWPIFRHGLLAILLLLWLAQTAMTAYAWGDSLRLAQELAKRAPNSPRAQYELGRTYIIYSHYHTTSPYTQLAYAPLERAAILPGSSILPQQALIFMNSRMRLPLKDAWWDSMIAKLKTRPLGVQDESSLAALVQCSRSDECDLPHDRMVDAFQAALSHPRPSARLLATYGDYAWNVLGEKTLGEQMIDDAVKTAPEEPAYRITLIRMLAAQGRGDEAKQAFKQLESLNLGGALNGSLAELHALPALQ